MDDNILLLCFINFNMDLLHCKSDIREVQNELSTNKDLAVKLLSHTYTRTHTHTHVDFF